MRVRQATPSSRPSATPPNHVEAADSSLLLAIARPEAAWSSRRRSIDASVLAAGPPKVSSRPQDEPIACPHDGAFREVGAVHDVHLSLENQHKLIERRALRKLFCGGAHGRHASRAWAKVMKERMVTMT